MKIPLMLLLVAIDLTAMQKVEIPDNTQEAALNIIAQTNKPASNINVTALNHLLKTIKAKPNLPDPEAGKLTKFDLLKKQAHKVLTSKLEGKAGSSVQGGTIVQEAEQLIDEAVEFWVSNAKDEATSHKRQKIGAMITAGISLAGNVALVATFVYFGKNDCLNPFSSAS